MKKLSLLFVIALVISSCSRERSSAGRTTLGVRMPEVSSLHAITPAVSATTPYTNSGLWGLQTPVGLSELDCFGIAVSFPEETKNSCHLLSGGEIDIDEMFGSVGAGSLLQADITSGEARRIQVFGFATANGSCPQDITTLSKAQMSQASPPVILGETLVDVEGESMEVEILISMSNPIVVNDCAGEWFAWEEGAPTSTQFNLDSGYLTLTGSNLGSAHSAKIVDSSGVETQLFIESKNNNSLAMKALSALDLAGAAVYELFISNAFGQEIYSITVGGAATSGTLSSMGAVSGQILKFDGTNWVPADLSAMTYAGVWDASACTNPNPSAVGGEYYIVSVAGASCDPGDGNLRAWSIGDWVIFNDNTSTWDQVSAGTQVTSFNGRSGAVVPVANDYAWSMLDFTTSSLNDIADVNSISATTGQVLKFDGTSWSPANDISGGGAGSITSTELADGSIVDADISASAAIAQSKIAGLTTMATDIANNTTSISSKLDMSAIDTDITLAAMSDSMVPSQNAVKTYVDNTVTSNLTGKEDVIAAGTIAQFFRGDKTWQALDTSAVTEGANLYYTAARAKTDVVLDGTLLSGVTNQSPSHDAVFNALNSKLDIAGGSLTGSLSVAGPVSAIAFQGSGGSSATSPLYSFNGSPTTGFFSNMTDVISVSLAGTSIFNFDAGRLISPATGGAAIRSNSGNATNPTYSFATFEQTGMYVKQVNGMLGFSVQGTDRLIIDATNGFIGMGTNTPAYNLDVAGIVAGTGAYVNSSDIRYKRDIELVSYDGESALEKIAKLNGYYYYWRLDEFPNKKFSEGRDLGVIAQEVEEVFPEAVVEDSKGFKSVAYSKLISPLIEAVKELFSKSEADKQELQRELASVRAENKMMKDYLCEKDSKAPFCP